MSYSVYLGTTLLPITPSSMSMKIGNQNSTLNLIDYGEVNLLKSAGLTTVSFDALLPNVSYPFATYTGGYQPASTYLAVLESLKTAVEPFQFIVTRSMPNGTSLSGTNLTVALEDYTIKEDAGQGFDVLVSITFKQYVAYGTKTCTLTIDDDGTTKAEASTVRITASDFVGCGSTVTVTGDICTDTDGTDVVGSGAGDSYTINYMGTGAYPYHVVSSDGTWAGWVSADAIGGG